MATKRESPSGRDDRRRRGLEVIHDQKPSSTMNKLDKSSKSNIFVNDGSFMDMFKKGIASSSLGLQDQKSQSTSESTHRLSVVDEHGHTRKYAAATTYYVRPVKTPTNPENASRYPSELVQPPLPPTETSRVDPPPPPPPPSATQPASSPAQPKKSSLLSFVGRRRGGKTLPTGAVKKAKTDDGPTQVTEGRTDAWSQYMAEVRKYKEMSCEDEGKTRPLVK